MGFAAMRRFLGSIVGVVVLAGAAWLGGPHLWAWYHVRAARSALEQYHAAEARTHCDACLKVWPDSVGTHLLASRAARQADAFEDSDQHLRQAQRLVHGTSDEIVLEWALLRAAGGDLADVEDYLHGRADREPARAPVIWEALAQGYLRMYRILDALNVLERWLERQPDNVQALSLRGNLWRQVKQAQKAAPDYRRAVELDPTREEDRWWLAVSVLEFGRYEEALKHLEVVQRSRPGDPEVLVRMARCHDGLGQAEQARQLLDAVLAEHPDHGPALWVRGQMLLANGQLADAEPWLRRAVAATPHDYAPNWALSECLRRQHKEAEAREQAARVEELKAEGERLADITHREMTVRPRDPALHAEMGTLLLKAGQREMGERWLLSALRLDPLYRPAHEALARFYAEHGQPEQAALHRAQAEALPVSAHQPRR
jgi:tetratricopeptide (TPR) repeat protein